MNVETFGGLSRLGNADSADKSQNEKIAFATRFLQHCKSLLLLLHFCKRSSPTLKYSI